MQRRTKLWLVAVLGAATFAACQQDPCEEVFVELAPRITLDVCAGNSGTSECSIDFGQVALSTRATREIKVRNPSNIVLKLTQPTFSEASDPAFRVEHWPDHVGEGLESTLVVSFRPLVESEVTGELLVHSDAANMPNAEPVRVSLKGSGIDNGLPQIEIKAQAPCLGTYPGTTEPTSLGITAVDYPAKCTFEVFNRGTKDLVLENITFIADETDNGFDFVGRVPGVDPDTGERFESVIPPPDSGNTSSRSFVARGAPPALGIFNGVILVECNDPANSALRIPVAVEGAVTPNAMAAIKSINGDEHYPTPLRVEPLDDVMLTAEGSTASSGSLRIVEYRWEIINQPPGSHGALDDTGSMTPRFVFDSSSHIINGVDIAGFWEVKLTVVDSRGAGSVNEAVVSFNAIPTDAIHIQLVWDTPSTDIDLHLVHENPTGVYDDFDDDEDGDIDDDCYFANCKAQSDRVRVQWFSGQPDANPSLDVDDLDGYGPENINIDSPATGKFMVAVHYWGGSEATVAVIRLYVFGNLYSEYMTEIVHEDWWKVAIIEWPSRTITEVNEVVPGYR